MPGGIDSYTNDEGDPINPRKAGGPGWGGGGGYVPPPPGGTQVGPGGGFGGAFGGSGFFGGDVGGEPFGMPRRRIVMGPNGPISVASSPMGTDTVPAMLTPGEGVLNVGAMQQPGMTDFLQAANRHGVSQMAEGGMVAEPLDRAMLMKLLRLLLDDGEDEVQGLAFGGMVQHQQGGFGRSRMPGGGLTGMNPARRPKFLPGQPQQPSVPGLPGPPNTPISTTPDNPWGDIPFTPGSPNPGDEQMARLWKMLQGFGDFGSFSPEGSKGVMEAVRREATSNADALRRRAALNADVSGLDAGQRGSYAMQSDLNTQGDVANILSNAQLQQLLGQQQFGQNMLGKFSDAQMQAWLARLASWMKGGG